MTYRVAHISDTHLSAAKPFFTQNFLRIGAAIADAEPDLVLNSGDISLDGAGTEQDLAAARELHDRLGLKLRFLPGNHDLGDSQDSPGRGEHPINAERRQRYLRHFGPDWWTVDVPGWRLLGINAQLLGSDLAAGREQELFVEAAADMLDGRHLALFLHKPLFDRNADETEITGRFVNPVPRRRLLERLGTAQPALVVCGHVHQYRESWVGPTRHVWGASTGYIIPDRRQPRYGLKEVGYVEHRLHEDGAHDSEFVRVSGVPTLDIADFPAAYGPL
jgi:3',5'-cyclic AMP phosphodiesterase CpdA